MTTTATTATILSGFPLRARMFGALMRREFLEHKMAFFTAPAIIGALIIGIIALVLVTAEIKSDQIMMHIDDADFIMEDGVITVDGQNITDQLAKAVAVVPSTPLLLILPFIIVFPLLGALYEERRDRSYLFWKSMPVSDAEEVLAKLGLIAFIGPLFVFVLMMALGLATTILVTPFMWLHGAPAWDLLWSHFAFVTAWIGVAANYLVLALWAFPVFAWILLASAYAPKAPLMYAVLPPVVIGVIEAILFETTNFFEAIGRQLGGDYGKFVGDRIDARMRFNGSGSDNLTLGDAAAAFGDALTSGNFWMGMAIGIAFIAGAIWLRRYRI